MKKYFIYAIFSIIVILSGIFYILKESSFKYEDEIQFQTSSEKILETSNYSLMYVEVETTTLKMIKVYVCGAVNESKVIEIEEGKRIADALELAGGVSEEAELKDINLAAFLYDAQKIYVPKIGEVIDKIDFTEQNSSIGTFKININIASKSELMELDGIGEVTAQAIIDYRDKNGSFKSIEEIKNVSRIGEKSFEKIKDKITI